MSKLPTYIGVGAAVLIFGGAIVYGIMTRTDRATTANNLPAQAKETPAPPPPRTVPAGAREYRADEYHFSLLYPDIFTATEHEEDGARTITFESADGAQGFELFIVPYGEKTITPERLRRDIPSGVVLDQVSVEMDGVPGTIFYSKNYAIGDTREAWFIYKGFLYEVMTTKSQAPLLEDVLATWDFF